MSLIGHLLPPLPSTSKLSSTTKTSLCLQIPETTLQNPNPKPILLSKLLSLALAATLSSPLPALAIPSLNSQSSLLPPTTPFSQSKNLQVGLENGKIRPCPSTNPGCVSTNPKSSSFAFPLTIPENSSDNAIQKLQEAILKTQKNAKIQVVEDTPNGTSKSLADCRVWFLRAQFHRQSFRFNPNFDSHRRGWRSSFRGLTTDGVVYGLIIANAAVFMLWRVADPKFMRNNFMISLDNFRSGRLHTLITSAFSHIDVGHLVSNMIGLYFFGMNIGRAFGPEFLLKLYLAGALGGSIFFLVHKAFMAPSSKGQQLWYKDPSNTPGLGASGAVNAIMLLDIFLFPKSTLYFDFFIPVPAILLGIFLIGKDILRIIEGDSHISGSAHLGGAAVAAIFWARIRKGRF